MAENNNERVVLVAMDESKKSRYAFEWYLKNLRKEVDTVVMVYSVSFKSGIIAPTSYLGTPFPLEIGTINITADYERAEMKEKLEQLVNILTFHKITGSVRSIHADNAGEGIIHMAHKIGADLIVMGSKGRKTLRKTLFGSVSDYVIHHSSVPVIVCRYNSDKKSSH